MDVHPLIDHRPDPDHPGWWSWTVKTDTRFNRVLGKLLVREGGPGRGLCRMFPDESHANLGDMVHGGAILTFIDMALFAGGRLAGADVNRAVTLDLSTRFLSPGRIGVPLDAEVELLRETGRLVFLDGRVKQGDELIASFTGALRKFARKP
jgi:acyl-coenzyme A thioesterase PaaI-like protein